MIILMNQVSRLIQSRVGRLFLLDFCVLWLGLQMGVSSCVLAEDWKGTPSSTEWALGGLTGLAIVDATSGFVVLGNLSKKMIQPGFLPDISDSVSFEGQFGPIFVSGGPAWFYSAHLRWDFEKDLSWTFYALGGVGGNIWNLNSSTRFEFFPRFGIGSFWKMSEGLRWRAELSHELISIGLMVAI